MIACTGLRGTRPTARTPRTAWRPNPPPAPPHPVRPGAYIGKALTTPDSCRWLAHLFAVLAVLAVRVVSSLFRADQGRRHVLNWFLWCSCRNMSAAQPSHYQRCGDLLYPTIYATGNVPFETRSCSGCSTAEELCSLRPTLLARSPARRHMKQDAAPG